MVTMHLDPRFSLRKPIAITPKFTPKDMLLRNENRSEKYYLNELHVVLKEYLASLILKLKTSRSCSMKGVEMKNVSQKILLAVLLSAGLAHAQVADSTGPGKLTGTSTVVRDQVVLNAPAPPPPSGSWSALGGNTLFIFGPPGASFTNYVNGQPVGRCGGTHTIGSDGVWSCEFGFGLGGDCKAVFTTYQGKYVAGAYGCEQF
jgi:hypothetical protein